MPREFRVIYVDVHQRGRLASRIPQREPRPDSYHEASGLHHLEELVHLLPLSHGTETRAVRQRMRVRDDSLATAGSDHRYVRRLSQSDESLFPVGPRHPASRVYQGHTRTGDNLRCFPQVFWTGHDSRNTSRTSQLDLLLFHSGLRGHFQQNGTGTAGAHLPERFEHGIRHLTGPGRLSPPLGHRANNVRLVGDFVNGPQVLADCASRYLARDNEHGRRARVCVGQAGRGVVQSRSRDHQRDPGLTRRACITIGHVRRRLFMTCSNHADARLIPEGRDNPVYLYARDAEYGLDTLRYERLGKRFAAAHLDHSSPSI